MQNSEKPLLKLLSGQEVDRMPIWLMRQAGRYLPEYREIRAKADSFIDFCLSPKLATEATIQPITRFGFDAAIVFADILLVPFALHQKIGFVENEGPRLDPLGTHSRLNWDVDMLNPVFETISCVKDRLPNETTLIGFAGSPWTVACYMVDGKGQTGFPKTLSLTQENPSFLQGLFEQLHQSTLEYLGRQIEAGAEVIQLFESHGGLLQGKLFDEYVVNPTKRLVDALKAEYPDVPIIGFPRGAGTEELLAFAAKTGVDVLGLDQEVSLLYAKEKLRGQKTLQGNLHPMLLLKGGDAMKFAAEQIFQTFGRRHIFNLGHGVIKETPPEHVSELVNIVRGLN